LEIYSNISKNSNFTNHWFRYTQPFYGHFSGTTQVSHRQKRTSGLYGAMEDQQKQTLTICLGATPSGPTSAHLHHPPIFTGWMPSCRSVVQFLWFR